MLQSLFVARFSCSSTGGLGPSAMHLLFHLGAFVELPRVDTVSISSLPSRLFCTSHSQVKDAPWGAGQ